MIRFSRYEDYALLLIQELSKNSNKQPVSLSLIAQKHSISVLFLRNIAADLKKAGLITAMEGKNGGYKLTRTPDDISIGEIIEACSKKQLFSCCQETTDGRCKKISCPHGISLKRLSNEFLEKMYTIKISKML